MPERIRNLFGLITEAGSIFAVLFVMLGGAARDFRVPFDFNGDALEYLMQVKGTIENGWWWVHPRLSAPGEFAQVQFPSNPTVDQAIVWVVRLFTHEPGLVINLSWMIMVVLSGLIASRCLIILGISAPVARAVGLLFAFSPYALMRHINHFSLAIYLIPIPCTVALLVATGRWPQVSRAARWGLGIGCALVGLNYPYYAFFASFLILGTSLLVLVSERNIRDASTGLLMLAVVCLATAVNLAPTYYSWLEEGQPTSIPAKRPEEAEEYGLKIRQLVSPIPEHSFPWLQEWGMRESNAHYPLENENTSARLGLLGSVGFLALMTGIFVPRVGALVSDGPLFFSAARLTLATVLLGTIGGFGSVFNLLFLPDIRAYNRVAPFIALFSLITIALMIERALRASASSRWRERTVACAIAVVLVIGLFDEGQAAVYLNRAHLSIRAEWAAVTAFVGSLEQRLPAGTMVFQMPAITFLNEVGRERMLIFDHIKLYIPSTRLHWSYPAIADDVVRWQQQVSRLPAGILASALLREGFRVLLIDRNGYADQGVALLRELGVADDSQAVVLSDERYVALDLQLLNRPPVDMERLPRMGDTPGPATLGLPRCIGDTPRGLEWIGVTAIPSNQPNVDVPLEGDFFVTGWAVDGRSRTVAGDIDIVVGDVAYPAFYGIERADVAAVLKNPAYRLSGYTARLTGANIGAGLQPLSIRILASDRSCYYQGQRVWIEAEEAPSIDIDNARME